MNKEILQKILKTDSVKLSDTEIQSILDEELEKSPDEMDTQLIDLCLDILTSKDEAPEKKPSCKKKKLRTVLIIAAVISILAVLSVPVGAHVFKIEAAENAVQVFEDYIQFFFNRTKNENEPVPVTENSFFSEKFSEIGMTEGLLPTAFLDENFVIEKVIHGQDIAYSFYFRLEKENIKGSLHVGHYGEEYAEGFENSTNRIYSDVEIIKQVIINGVEMFVYSETKGDVNVTYRYGHTSYEYIFEDASIDHVLSLFQNLTEVM